nr:UBN2 domain-containing protein [Tanacetum cinerariifolium]
ESIDSAFARFNTIITSLKALDEGYSIKNFVKKFLRALHSKWRAKVTAIEELKDLTSLSLDKLIENLKVHEMLIKKDYEIVKAKGERKSLALKAKKESSDEECSTFGSKDEEYAMVVRDFKKFFKRRDKNQRAFVGGSWSDSDEKDDEKAKDETCLVAQASNEVCFDSAYFSDENSSIDDLAIDNEYDKVKDKQEKDKIGSKPDKNGKRGEARQCQGQSQSRKQEKRRKYKIEGPKVQILQVVLLKEKEKGRSSIETHGFSFSWDQGVVEEKEVYYPVGFEGKRWKKAGKGWCCVGGKHCAKHSVLNKSDRGGVLFGYLQLWTMGFDKD